MPAKTRSLKRPVRTNKRFLFDQVFTVPIETLKPHPKNPRVGDVDAIAESLTAHGLFKPVVVNKRNNRIAAGHHTVLAARKLGWADMQIVYIDVDEDSHMRIMLHDNATSDKGEYDKNLLAEILANLATQTEGLEGTGYNEVEFQDLIAEVQTSTKKALDDVDLDSVMANMPETTGSNMTAEDKKGREKYDDEWDEDDNHVEANKERGVTKPDKEADQDIESDDIEDAEAELQAVLEVKMERFDFWMQSKDEYQIPELRDDYLFEKLPKKLQTWGGNEATPDDGRSWFLYNYSLGGLKGLPFDRSILCFYTHDDKFEGWWQTPAWYTARVLTKGIRSAVVPDFSFYFTMPRVMHLWNVYRAQWLGRYFQEAGMKVIPRLQFNYRDPDSLEIGLRGIPRGCPVLATSQQNPKEKSDIPLITKMMQDALDEIKPKQLLYYSGPPGRRAMEGVKYNGEVTYLMNYVGVRREVVYGKKEGLQGVSSKNRAKTLDKARKRLGVNASKPADGEGEEFEDDDE